MKSFNNIHKELIYSYNLGSRFLVFDGGEPTLWHDSGRDVNDLVVVAKKIGFFTCTIVTNGQHPLYSSKADNIRVSLDGTQKYHDDIRGDGTFAKIEKNIVDSDHPNITVKLTINTHNAVNVVDTIKYANTNPHIKQIYIGFHTPFPGTEYLALDWESRARIIDTVIQMKRKGYPIMNSISGLKRMKNMQFNKQCWMSNFIMYDGVKPSECPGNRAGLCNECGFSMAGEMHSIFNFRIDTFVTAARKLRMLYPALKQRGGAQLATPPNKSIVT